MTGNSEKPKGESLKAIIFATLYRVLREERKERKDRNRLMGIGWFAKLDADWSGRKLRTQVPLRYAQSLPILPAGSGPLAGMLREDN